METKLKEKKINEMLNFLDQLKKDLNFELINKLNIYSDPESNDITIDANLNIKLPAFKMKMVWHGKNILAIEFKADDLKQVLLIEPNRFIGDWIIINYSDNSHTEIKVIDFIKKLVYNAN